MVRDAGALLSRNILAVTELTSYYVLANLARGKPTKQTSTAGHGKSSLAVDGSTETSHLQNGCAHTDKQQNPWWRVDLGKVEPVGKVIVTNRGDCCYEKLRRVEIRVGNIDDSLAGNEM